MTCYITHATTLYVFFLPHFWPGVYCPPFLVLNNALFCLCLPFSCCYATSTELDGASCSWSTQATTSTAASNGNLRREASVLLWYVGLQSDCYLFLDITCRCQTSILFWNKYIASLLIYQFFGLVKILKMLFPLDQPFVIKKILISSINNIFTYYICTFFAFYILDFL